MKCADQCPATLRWVADELEAQGVAWIRMGRGPVHAIDAHHAYDMAANGERLLEYVRRLRARATRAEGER